jgi:CheY-like chemotaxis protein
LDQQTFDVVFMDVQMPEMDGFEAVQNLRKREENRGFHLPVIAMTAHAMTGDKERCIKAGMDDYITKPFRALDMLQMVEKYRKKTFQYSEEALSR